MLIEFESTGLIPILYVCINSPPFLHLPILLSHFLTFLLLYFFT